MNAFEAAVAAERRKGWYVYLTSRPEGWECRLECGIDVLKAGVPRPRATGITAEAAFYSAVRDRNQHVKAA